VTILGFSSQQTQALNKSGFWATSPTMSFEKKDKQETHNACISCFLNTNKLNSIRLQAQAHQKIFC
jgi:hypothetical protein